MRNAGPKINAMLDDEKIQKQNNKIMKGSEDKECITIEEGKQLKINNSMPPRFYGLPIAHKKDTPLRSIVSSMQNPTNFLLKFLVNTIKNIIDKNEYHGKGSWDFFNFIKTKNKQFPKEYQLISLDVTFLYINIPTNLVLQSVRER